MAAPLSQQAPAVLINEDVVSDIEYDNNDDDMELDEHGESWRSSTDGSEVRGHTSSASANTRIGESWRERETRKEGESWRPDAKSDDDMEIVTSDEEGDAKGALMS